MRTTRSYTVLVDQQRAAEILDVSERTMEAWRGSGFGPRFVRLSRRAIRYRLEDLEEFIEERLRRSTSDPGEGQS